VEECDILWIPEISAKSMGLKAILKLKIACAVYLKSVQTLSLWMTLKECMKMTLVTLSYHHMMIETLQIESKKHLKTGMIALIG